MPRRTIVHAQGIEFVFVHDATHVLYWPWLIPERRVLIITCFRRDD
jgi:hypothetical protein